MLSRLQLEHFRNFQKLDLKIDLATNIHVFHGQNAQGKTNILEAIALLAFTKSFRGHDREIPFFGSPYSRVQGCTSEFELEWFYQSDPLKKALKKNGIQITPHDFIGHFRAVLFQPDDIHTFFSAPSLRRRALNRLLSQKNPIYFQALHDYTRTLKQRNAALRAGTSLSAWNQQLMHTGTLLINERSNFVRFFQTYATQHYETISGTEKKLMMFYQPSVMPKTFLHDLEKFAERDRLHGHTTVGPHRDDLLFTLDGHEVPSFASRGELRSIVLTFKLIEAEYLTTADRKPIFLLDDLFSELDSERSEKLAPLFNPYQVFLTAIDLSVVPERIRNSARHYNVRAGNCYTEENVPVAPASSARRLHAARARSRDPLGHRVLL